MGILCDSQIRELVGIEPFEDNVKRPGKISYGVSSYGYDLRVGSVFKVFTNVNSEIVDPKHFSERSFVTVDTDETGKDYVLIPPNSFALCETVETVDMPRGLLAICVGKSTYARCGIIVNVTPIEPEWRGKITLEISNTTPLPAKIYANEGIAQLIFLKGDRVCAVSYADKSGKYQDQLGHDVAAGGLSLEIRVQAMRGRTMMRSAALSFFVGALMMIGVIGVIGGCAATAPDVSIPHDATLLFLGNLQSMTFNRPGGPGRVYLYDDSARRLVGVVAVTDDQAFHFTDLDSDHRYRIYFQPDASLRAATTRPS